MAHRVLLQQRQPHAVISSCSAPDGAEHDSVSLPALEAVHAADADARQQVGAKPGLQHTQCVLQRPDLPLVRREDGCRLSVACMHSAPRHAA